MVFLVSELSSINQEACRWRRRKEARPAEILKAALKTFSQKGFAASKLDLIAKEAGVSKGTLYLYFSSKEALFKAVVNEFVLPQIEKAEEQAEQYDGTICELMFALLEHWQTNVLDTDLSGISKLMIAEAGNFPELASFYLENVIQRTRHLVAQLIELGIKQGEFKECDSQYAARAFLNPMLFSAIWQHSLEPFDDDYDVKQYLHFHLDTYLNGMLKVKR